MPKKYHIETSPVPPRRPRVGRFGIVDWREDCSRCHNCVKKACVYDRYRQETEYIRNLTDVDVLFFDCMGCFSCVQECTKGLLTLSLNPVYEKMGNHYWRPEIIHTTWLQAETARIPVSGAGYRGKFSGEGFDSMWTDMSEIVRPTRDGIHGREYISTSVDIGRKPSYLTFTENNGDLDALGALVDIPMPLLIDMMPREYSLPQLEEAIIATARNTGLIALIDARKWPDLKEFGEDYLPHIAFYLDNGAALIDAGVLHQTRLVEIADGNDVHTRIEALKKIHPEIVVVVRVELTSSGVERAIELGKTDVEAIHVVADLNGNEIESDKPRFLKEMIRQIHGALIENGHRDEVTLIAGGGIALAEHVAKGVICGADLVSMNVPLLAGLECHLCQRCEPGVSCPAKLESAPLDYCVGRMTNLIAAWHGQLIEVMGAMGMREIRRLQGETGRAMFFEDLEEQTFGRLFGSGKQA
jgi:ferredoxin